MGLKLLVNATEDFTGEFRKTANTQAQWKMNDSPSGDDTTLHDSSGHARNFTINGWSGTTASTRAVKLGKFFRFNTVNPATEKTHLRATNTGDFFTALGKRIVAGGWIYPTTYSVGTTFVPIFSTRSGPGNPLFYLSLRSGRLRNMLYDASVTNKALYSLCLQINDRSNKIRTIVLQHHPHRVWFNNIMNQRTGRIIKHIS